MSPVAALRRVPLLLVVALLAACSKSEGPAPGGAAAPGAGGPPPAVPVTVVTLKAQSVTLTRELPGRTSASVVAEVRPQANGIVKQKLFTEGSRVKAGQVLYQLDDATYRADVGSAEAALVRAQATLETARLNARRLTELVQIDAVSRQDYENAVAAQKQGEADVAAARANVDRVKVLLGYTRITAPIAGRIGKSSVTQGALVTANQAEPLARVQQLDPVYVDVSQSSAEWLDLRKQMAGGQLDRARDVPVTILLEDGTRYPSQGKLSFADVSVDPTTGSFLIRVVVPNPKDILLPGMYVRAVVASGVRPDAVLVPQRALSRDPKGNTSAMVVGPDNKVAARPVRVSTTIGDQWLVEEGLAAGDRVVVEGLQKIRPGASVVPAEAGTAPAAGPGPAAAGTPAQPGAPAGAAATNGANAPAPSVASSEPERGRPAEGRPSGNAPTPAITGNGDNGKTGPSAAGPAATPGSAR